jgi:hypothetical protein
VGQYEPILGGVIKQIKSISVITRLSQDGSPLVTPLSGVVNGSGNDIERVCIPERARLVWISVCIASNTRITHVRIK